MPVEVNVPDIGDFKDVPVITVLVKVGDTIAAEDPLIELESDKATMEVPSPVAGRIASIVVKEGDRVSEGSVILTVEAEGSDAAAAASAPTSAPAAAPAAAATRLSVIQASHGTQIHMVPVADVVYFEAADKYVRVLTAEREYLIRTALKELIEQLDPQEFWQVHRSTLVRATHIATVTRDEAGKQHISLRGRPERLPVSRLYAHLFKAM